ncbi:MAG: hypothetical protein OZ934_01710 [Anaerolineae bacterium]|nr:hypothetical protein [Anaerolineae bacterium]
MSFLKRLLGGGGKSGDPEGLYFYVRAAKTGEVIRVRLNRSNDLSLTEDLGGYFARKVIVGQKSFERIETHFHFDKNRHFVSADVTGGELVEREDYETYLAAQAPRTDQS